MTTTLYKQKRKLKSRTIAQEIESDLIVKVKKMFPPHLKVSYEKWREDTFKLLDKLNYYGKK